LHLEFVLAPDLDTGALPPATASFGTAHVGPSGLVDRLETALGLSGPVLPDGARAAALVPGLRATAGFWSESTLSDPLGVARELLRWRDTLRLAGWQGEPVSPRLSALAAVTAEVPPGPPDRLEVVARAIAARDPEVGLVTLLEREETLPPLVRNVLDALRARGTTVRVCPPAPAAAGGDLAAARAPGFRPVGDGSLQLVRPAGSLEAAETIAAWLAADPDRVDTVIIGADATLDTALHRHGLPTTGGAGHGDGSLLQLLPLLLALGWSPTDPRRALELLTLPISPIPRSVAWRLVAALQVWPAVDSDAWRTAVAEALAAVEEPERRATVRARVETFLVATVQSASYPAPEARRRVDALARWLQVRAATSTDETVAYGAALNQSKAFRRLLDLSALDPISAPQLRRLVEDASDAAGHEAPHPAQAGFRVLAGPAGLVGPAARVVWWSFRADAAPALPRLPLSGAERGALAAIGVELPSAAAAAMISAERWRRPLLQTTERLVLVSPEVGEDGSPVHPHPLWDEVVAGIPSDAHADRLVQRAPMSARLPTPRVTLALPAPRRAWTVGPGTILRREKESPSSLATLVGCSLQWTLSHVAKVHGGSTAALPEGQLLHGSLVHEIIARVLKSGPLPDPEDAEAEAVALFDSEAPRWAALLFQPGAEHERERVRRVAGLAVASLVRSLAEAGLTIETLETPYPGTGMGGALEGTPDLVATDGAPAVIDLKWGGAKYRREELGAGVSTQLATYAHLVRPTATAPYPAVAYFILQDQRLYTTEPDRFPGATSVKGPGPAETWKLFERAWQDRWAATEAGAIEASGNAGDDGTEPIKASHIDQDGRLRLAPPCRFCNFGNLCGNMGGE
jgi:hypothetical protein